MKKLWSFEDKCAKLNGNFAAETPFGRVFRSCETTFWHTSAILQHSSPHFKLRNGYEMGCENISPLRNHLWAAKLPIACEMISKLRKGCEITSKHRNGLQIVKLTCEMAGDLQKHFAKPREVVKMPSEPCNHAYEEESPAHPGITHTKSLTPFLTSLNHHFQSHSYQLRAPVEKTMPSKETT